MSFEEWWNNQLTNLDVDIEDVSHRMMAQSAWDAAIREYSERLTGTQTEGQGTVLVFGNIADEREANETNS